MNSTKCRRGTAVRVVYQCGYELVPLINEFPMTGQLAADHQANLCKRLDETRVGASSKPVHLVRLDYDYRNPIEAADDKRR